MRKMILGFLAALLVVATGVYGAPTTLNALFMKQAGYSEDDVTAGTREFEQANPNISVNMTDYTWPTYHDTMVLRFKGKTQTDVMYNGEDWLPEFAAAGWVAPLSDYFPAINAYKAKLDASNTKDRIVADCQSAFNLHAE